MVIANPIYDAVFKYLFEDNRIARLIISTIIEEEIEDLEFRPQERTALLGKYSILVYRIDFAARIRTKSGEHKNVLIEIQKAKFPADIMRFRKYLGEQYLKSELVGGKNTALPIITIYFLGFELSKIDSPAIKVNRSYIDAITGEEITEKDDFIEQLTHNSYVIQIPRLKAQRRNRLEIMLRIFDQNLMKDNRFILDLEEDLPEEFKVIRERLERAAMDKELRDKLELEEEVEGLIENKEREWIEELEKKDKKLEEKDKKLEEKDKKLEEKDKKLEKKDKKLEEKDRIIEELKKKLAGA